MKKGGYHNHYQIVSRAFTKGLHKTEGPGPKLNWKKYHGRLNRFHQLVWAVRFPAISEQGLLEEAEGDHFNGITKSVGDDFYLEIQRHKATVRKIEP